MKAKKSSPISPETAGFLGIGFVWTIVAMGDLKNGMTYLLVGVTFTVLALVFHFSPLRKGEK